MTEEHAADEAAGEVIYSSDGLPTSPPPKYRKSFLEKVDDATLDTTASNASHAFEVFSGKVYPVQTMGGAIIATKSETPTQRLARLQQEVAELEQDLSSSAEEAAGPALMQVVTDLKQRLQTQTGVVASAKNQAEMTLSIQQHLDEWQLAKAASSGDDAPKPETSGVVYELYGGVSTAAASAAPSVEERLLQVESLLGGSTGGSKSSSQSLLTRLEEMESFLKGLNAKGLEQASAKAKVIRSDLEAASKARNKLASAASFRKEDAKTIAALYDQMTQLEGLTDHLPALVARLQQLASLHSFSSTFSVRLTQSEKEVTQLQGLVKQLEDTVVKAETGMVENVKVIETNMQKLDERITKL